MAKPANTLQQRITVNSAVCGTIIALMIVVFDAAGVLAPMEGWLYDVRARTCQFFTPAPSKQIVHLNIDDDSLEVIGRYPWDRRILAALLDELALTKPKAVAIDLLLTEPQEDRDQSIVRKATTQVSEADDVLAAALRRVGSVVLPASFKLQVNPSVSDAESWLAAVAAISQDPLITPADLSRRLTSKGVSPERAEQLRQDFSELRRVAVRDVVRQRLINRSDNDPQEIERALAAASASTMPAGDGATRVLLPLGDVVVQEHQRVSAELSLGRFALIPSPNLRAPPADVVFNEVPLLGFCKVIAATGFVDFNFFPQSRVRHLPLVIRNGDRLFPQFGLAMACMMLDADLSRATLRDGLIVVPAPSGDVRIPVRSQHSASTNRDIGFIMDIPWFGTRVWETMYDWPAHRNIVNHYSMNVLWNVIEIRERLARNNATIDRAMQIALDQPARVAEYVNRAIPVDDYSTRRELVLKNLEDLKELGVEEFFRGKKDAELSVPELNLRDSIAALRALVTENDKHQDSLLAKRTELTRMFGGKGVFIGSAATGLGDFVPTSLHIQCPGVVVHGVIANAILNRNFLRPAPAWVPILLTLMFGLLTTALTSRMEPIRAVPLLLLIGGAYFALNGLLLFGKLNIILDAAAPLVAMGICWGGCMIVRLVVEGLERIRREREAAVIEHEINLARQVQAALIPKQLSILTKVQSHGWTLAATTTGGDCFDLWKLADGRLGILVADASGHGLGPSIIVSEVRALVRVLCDLYPEPQKLLDRINQRIAADLQATKFCTAFLGFLSEDGQLTWGSAGHGPMLWAATPDGEVKELEGTGLPLGVSDEWFGDPEVPVLQLEPGGWLAVISDGIFEQPNPAGEQFGVDRVKEAIKSCKDGTCEKVVETLRDTVFGWQVVTEANDDQTIVFVRLAGAQVTQVEEPATDAPGTAVAVQS